MIEKSRWREPAEELPLVLTLSFHDLRAAGSQPAQCLNQNRKSARQAAETAMLAPCMHAIWTTIAHSVSPLGRSPSIMASAALTAISDTPLFGRRAAAYWKTRTKD